MGLLNQGVTFMNFDETYFFQKKLHTYPHEHINLFQLPHVHLYCEKESLKIIERKLVKRKHKGITFIGSGNYHYITYLLLKEIQKPFTLILFDHHSDINLSIYARSNIISCGNWVSFS